MSNVADDLRTKAAAFYVGSPAPMDADLLLRAAAELDRLETRLATYTGLWFEGGNSVPSV
jgi:hypothetical protein